MSAWVWSDLANVRPGDFILDPAGNTQKVLGRDAQGVLLIDGTFQTSRAPLVGAVQVWDGPMQEAINVIARELGGKVVHDSTRRQA